MSQTCDRCKKEYNRLSAYQKHINKTPQCKRMSTAVKPVLKWVGGKSQILEDVLDQFPQQMVNYHEPFLGGGSVLLGILTRRQEGKIAISGTIYASDLNANLIAFYRVLQNDPDFLITEANRLVVEASQCLTDQPINRTPATIDQAMTSLEAYYFWIRGQYNRMTVADKGTARGAAMFLFINKNGFRGMYREGPHGINVPYGNYGNPFLMDIDHVHTVSRMIQGVVFMVRPFLDALSHVQAGDFVYLDPPYAPETNRSFVGYMADGFNADQHEQLFARCATLPCRWLMSNADVPLVREAFIPPTYLTTVITCRRAIHSKHPETVANEVMIVRI